MNEPQPVLPASPWYTSEVFARGAIAAIGQVISIGLRLVGRLTDFSVTTDFINAVVADATQIAAVVFGVLMLMARSKSPVAPLTLSEGAAALRNDQNPPLLKTDPTKGVQK